MTHIVGFAGKKQSGKNTACNFILALKLAELGVCNTSRLTDTGGIEVTDILGESGESEWLPFEDPFVDTKSLFDNELGGFIRMYALADSLKEVAVNVLGLSHEQAYGTDEDKNTHTDIRWEDMPGIITPSELKKKGFTKKQAQSLGLTVHASGKMTAREVLQYVGTDVFRKINSNVWLDSLFRRIEEEGPELALVSDVRFENEIKGIQKQGGFVVGLNRDPYQNEDRHASETQVGKCLDLCDCIVENSDLSISEQNEQIYYAISHLEEVIPEVTDAAEEEEEEKTTEEVS